MPNIIVTTRCNLDCRYCRVKRIKEVFPEECDMTFYDFSDAVKWIGEGEIGIKGGEPLLHPLIDDFLSHIKLRNETRNVTLYTNGILIDEHIKSLVDTRFTVRLDLKSPNEIGDEAFNRVIENIKALRIKSVPVELSITLYDKDFDYSYILPVIEEFSFTTLFAELTPLSYTEPDTAEEYLKSIQDVLLSLTRDLAERGCGIKKGCACLPACQWLEFSSQCRQLAEEKRVEIDIFSCANCSPKVEILPSRRLLRCTAVISEDLTYPFMQEFNMPHHAYTFFDNYIDNMVRPVPMNDRCISCYEKLTGSCQGGCLGFLKKQEVLTGKAGSTCEQDKAEHSTCENKKANSTCEAG